jgi:hypothetical protein
VIIKEHTAYLSPDGSSAQCEIIGYKSSKMKKNENIVVFWDPCKIPNHWNSSHCFCKKKVQVTGQWVHSFLLELLQDT